MKFHTIPFKHWLSAFVITGLASAGADVVSSYTFVNPANENGSDTLFPAVFEATTFDPNVTAGNWIGGASFTGLTSVGADPDQTMQVAEANGLEDGTDDDIAGAIAADQYLGFTVTANGSNILNLDSLEFDIQRAANGPNDYSVRSSVDDFATDLTGNPIGYADQGITTTRTVQTIDLSDPSFDGLTSIEFRIYVDDRQTNNGGGSAVVFDDVVLNGLVFTPGASIWQTDGDGDWFTLANWDPSVPNAANAVAIFSDTLPFTGPLTASLDGAVTLGDLSFSSAQPITIAGPSALTLDGPGLANISASTGSHEISANVSLADPLEVTLAADSVLDLSGPLSGTSSVTSNGEGQLTVSGDFSGFSGGLFANSGTLEVTGSGANSDISIDPDVTLSGEGSHTGTLNLAANSILLVDSATAEAFTTGTLSPTAPVLVETTSTATGTFDVLNYSTYGGIVTTDFVSLSQRLTFADSAGTITATAAGAESITWTGATGTDGFFFWDNSVTQNWTSSDGLFFPSDSVTFGDTGVGFVDVAAEVAPATVTFTNTIGSNYTFEDITTNVETVSATTGGINITGDGDVALNVKVTGDTDIIHSGTGLLSLGGGEANNDFVGTITVDGGGILQNLRNQDDITSLGDFGNTFSFSNGSTFDLNSVGLHDDYQNYGTGSFLFGPGTTITNTGMTSNDAFGDQLVFDGDVTFEGSSRFDILGDISVTATDIVITLNNEAGTVLGGDQSLQSIAEWVVNDGILFASNDNAFGDAAVTVNPEGAVTGNVGILNDLGNGLGVATLANAITLNGGSLLANQPNTITNYSGAVTVTTDSRIDPNLGNRTIILSGTLAESGIGGDLTIGDGTTVIASTLDATGFTGTFILNETGATELEDGVVLAQDIVIADAGDNKQIRLLAGDTAEISGGITINEADAGNFDLNVQGGPDTLTVSGDISGSGGAGVSMTGPGKVILSGTNTYSGPTTVNSGVLCITAVDALPTGGDVTIEPSGILNLDFEGSITVGVLFIDGVAQPVGSFDSSTSDGVTGSGIINVTATVTPDTPLVICEIAFDDAGNVILTTSEAASGLTTLRANDVTLSAFVNVPTATASGDNEITIPAADVDPDGNGVEFYRVTRP